MVSINYAFREISCKIVYYGPGLSGKTTNLQYVHDRVPAKSRGDLISLATEADRTLYFDFLPIHVGDIGGFSTKFQLYTVPGQVFYNATRKLVLRGVDGIVFVADSQLAKMDENIESLANMYENLRENDIDVQAMPLVLQYNKRDLPEIASIEELEKTINPDGRPYVEASAVTGVGVFDTMKRITKLVLEDTKRKTSGQQPSTPTAIKSTTPSVPMEDMLTSSGPVSELRQSAAPRSDDGWNTDRHGAGAAAVAVVEPIAASKSSSGPTVVVAENSRSSETTIAGAARSTTRSDSAASVVTAQRSTRIRRRQRSLFDRLFGWLFGR
jgi:signal recognition particle receptor subunit beta